MALRIRTLREAGRPRVRRRCLVNDWMTSAGIRERSGVTHSETVARLAQDGYNELPAARSRSVPRIVFDVVREPMFMMLVSCAANFASTDVVLQPASVRLGDFAQRPHRK